MKIDISQLSERDLIALNRQIVERLRFLHQPRAHAKVLEFQVGDPGPSVSVREVPGIVTEVHEKAYVVRLDTGQTVRVYRNVDVARGAEVFLAATRHAQGEESFVLTESKVTTP